MTSRSAGAADSPPTASLRLDKLLWYLRLTRTRATAQAMVAAGHIRLDGRRIDRASTGVRAGSLLVLPGPPRVRVIRIVQLPARRGPPAEAAACFQDMAEPDGAE